MADGIEETNDFMRSLAAALDDIVNPTQPKKVGFVVLLFPFDEPIEGKVNYVSNGKRETVHVALKEILARWEGRMMPEGKA